MGWHVLTSTQFDFQRFARESEADNLPHHLLPMIAGRLGAEIHQPEPEAATRVDRLLSLIYGRPEHWALARMIAGRLQDGNAVYAAGCDIGIPVALLAGLRRRKVRFAIVFVHPDRTRTKVLGWFLSMLAITVTALVTTHDQAADLRRSFGRRLDGVHAIHGQTDCAFFRPAHERPVNRRPLIASCGVERRDYRTMGIALADLDIEAVVCFASPNKTAKTRFTMPDPIPENFTFEPLEFADLRNLYQEADLLVLPLLHNRYSAGLTTLFEAIACGAPVIVSQTPGMIQELVDEDLIVGVPPGDHQALRAAVEQSLANPEMTAERADQARKVVLERYSADSYMDLIEGILTVGAAPVIVEETRS